MQTFTSHLLKTINVNINTLKLFNAVIANYVGPNSVPFVSEEGFIIEAGAVWAKDDIIAYYRKEQLSGNDLNKTFHKSWDKIKNSSRFALAIDQIMHYLSTYGTNFKSEMYIPEEILNVPDAKLTFKVIKAYSPQIMIEKCLDLFRSGIALKEETIDELLSILVNDLNYAFTGSEGIKNKEAIVKIADVYNVLPTNVMDFFRYIIYRATDSSLIIKNEAAIQAIKSSSYNPVVQFDKFGLEKLAEIFNRFKPLFLAFKPKAGKAINKISKLSKKHHKPLVFNPLNSVTNTLLTDQDLHWLDNATPFALFKAMSACYARMNEQDTFLYRIRNGKSWVKKGEKTVSVNYQNYEVLSEYLKLRFKLDDRKIFIPKDIKYALPTSEKMFVGNIPTGTRFYGKKLSIGIYWENDWGASDLDLSGLNIGGKVGWNASYNQGGELLFSGDITDAPHGAVEYLYANKGLNAPTLITNNVYYGDPESGYKIIIGKGNKMSREYMMDPNNLIVDIKTKSVQIQTILGIVIPKKDKKQCFVLLNFGSGHARVSGYGPLVDLATKALYQQWNKPLSFNKIVKELGAQLVDSKEKANVDLSLDSLEKDSFTKLFR